MGALPLDVLELGVRRNNHGRDTLSNRWLAELTDTVRLYNPSLGDRRREEDKSKGSSKGKAALVPRTTVTAGPRSRVEMNAPWALLTACLPPSVSWAHYRIDRLYRHHRQNDISKPRGKPWRSPALIRYCASNSRSSDESVVSSRIGRPSCRSRAPSMVAVVPVLSKVTR